MFFVLLLLKNRTQHEQSRKKIRTNYADLIVNLCVNLFLWDAILFSELVSSRKKRYQLTSLTLISFNDQLLSFCVTVICISFAFKKNCNRFFFHCVFCFSFLQFQLEIDYYELAVRRFSLVFCIHLHTQNSIELPQMAVNMCVCVNSLILEAPMILNYVDFACG